MSFNSCVVDLKLIKKLQIGELREVAAEYEQDGMTAEAALQRAVEDKIGLLKMEERSIVAAVRGAYEAKGGSKKAVVEVAPAEAPAPATTAETVSAAVAAIDARRPKWIPVDDLRTYSAKEAAAEWDKASAGSRRATLARIDMPRDSALVAKSWADIGAADRKLVTAALNEDHYFGSWYTNKKGQRVDHFSMPKAPQKSAEELALEAGEARWNALDHNERFHLLLMNGISGPDGRDAEHGKFSPWRNLAQDLRDRMMAGWEAAEAPAKRAAAMWDRMDAMARVTELTQNSLGKYINAAKSASWADLAPELRAALLKTSTFERLGEREQIPLSDLIAQSTPAGANAAGEKLYDNQRGTFRVRSDRKDQPEGYADFGGDLAPVDLPAPTNAEMPAESRARGADNKIFTLEAAEKARAILRAKLGQLNSGIDPELMQAGIMLAGFHIEAGARSFANFASTMVADLGENIRPFLRSFYEGVRHYPGIDGKEMSSSAEIDAHLAAEAAPVPEAIKKVIGTAPKATKKSKAEPGNAVLRGDYGVAHIDGWSTSDEFPAGPAGDYPSGGIKAAFTKDAQRYLKDVAATLLDHGFAPQNDGKGKPMKPVSSNEGGPAVAGDVSLTMFNPEIGHGIYVTIGASGMFGFTPTTKSGISVMMRVTDAGKPYGGRENMWMDPGMSARDLAEDIVSAVSKVASRSKSATLDTNASTKDDNGQGNTRGESPQALGNLATGENGAAGEGRGAERGDPSGRDSGAQADRGSDGAGVPDARSGGSGVEAVHPADAGTTAGGRLGGAGTGGNGKRVSGKNAGARAGTGTARVTPAPTPAAAPSLPAVNFRITDDLRLGQGGEVEKFNDNIAAIRTMKAIEAANRRATPEEQSVLARYVGWGGLANAFPSPETGQFKDAWAQRGPELAELISPKEYQLARRSTLDSHYTSQTVVNGMWEAARQLGYKGGLALESSMGAGNFLGLIPSELAANTKFIGVEYDSLTARIATLLYPRETVLNSGFQSVPLSDGSFDLAIGNPPFGEQSLRFQFKPELNGHSIHNQFFLASLDALKPGGLQVQVVSRYLLDKMDTGSRSMLAKKARLLGAIRLPDTAFKENARTSVVTDIVFLQRLTPAEEAAMTDAFAAASEKPKKGKEETERRERAALVPDWVKTTTIPDPLGGEPMPINTYFARNPSMILGVQERSGSMAHGKDITVRLDKDQNLGDRLELAIASLPRDVMVQEQSAIDASIARHKDMSDALRISLAGHENGSIKLEAGGVLEQVIERETPEGNYELSKRVLSPASPWSDSLYMNSDGKWYAVEVVLGEDGKPVKQMKGDKATNLNVYDRKVFENEADIPAGKLLGESGYQRLKQLVQIRDHLKEQLTMEAENANAAAIEDNRAVMAAAYNKFVKAHGLISDPANSALVSNMPDGALVQALEFSYRPAISAARAARIGEKARAASADPAPILSKRVIVPYEAPTSAATLADAIAINTAESGRVDLDRIASLLGKTVEEIEQEIESAERPLLFKDPESGVWETRNDYLTGHVKRKLNAARAARMTQNITALEEVQPEPWGAEAVTALLGSSWVPPAVYGDFVGHITGSVGAHVSYSAITNAYSVAAPARNTAKEEEWGSPGYSAAGLISALLNSTQIKVTYTDRDGKTHMDVEKTQLALLKAKAITAEWNDWVYKDGDRRNQLVEIFNEKFNTRVNRQHDGSHLMLPGKVPDSVISMRRHQKNAIWRGISERFNLFDHTVGAGKTFTAIAAAMERRRMGLSKKPAIVVPNHMVEQFTSDVYRLYPGAKVLAAGKKDFEKSRRRKLFAKIATGDFDIVIIPHSSFGFIGIAPETEERYLQVELDAATQAVQDAQEEADANGEGGGFRKPFGVKEAERLVDKITARMEKVRGDKQKDRLLTFEQMGIDDLTIDESHEFKNLFFSSRLTGVKGMGNKTGSQKAFDLYNKIRVLRETPTGKVTFMTGTPISNSAVEMYNVMRYLAADELKELGLEHFDAWRAQYVSTDAGWEPNETGRLKEVNRLGRTWSNMRSLMDLYYGFTDAVDNDDIKKAYAEDNNGEQFPIPRVTGGDRQSVVIQPTKAQLGLLNDVLAGFDALPNEKDPYERNKQRLRLMDRARKVSLDVRAAEPSSKSKEEGGKLDVIADNVKRIYSKWNADRGTQLIFLDRSVPKTKGDDTILKEYDALIAAQRKAYESEDENAQRRVGEQLEKFDPNEMEELRNAQAGGWNAYQQIKDNLIARGIPAAEIRFIQEANTDAQKQALFDAVNDGTVRVLIGSTPRMGAGTNVQQRIVAIHHADVTWKPSDIEQREGRGIRQGNQLLKKYGIDKFELEILAYATERTIDAKMWSLNASKLKTINAIRKYDGAFSMDFEDEDSVSMAELAALASGDPMLLERVKLISEIDKLELLKRQHGRKEWAITGQIEDAERKIERNPAMIEVAKQDLAAIEEGIAATEAAAKGRSVKVEGKVYTSGSDARKAVFAAVKAQQGDDETKKVSISVGERRLTSLSGAMDAVGTLMGDEATFSMRINGTEYMARTDAARAIAEIAAAKSEDLDKGDAVTVNLGDMHGFGLQANIERFALGQYQTSLALVREDGTTLASGETKFRENADYSTSAMRTAVEELDRSLTPSKYESRIEILTSNLEHAKRTLPELMAKKGGPFPQQDELDAKNARLEVVIRTLSSGPSTAARSITLRGNPLRNVDGSYVRQAPARAVYTTTSVEVPAAEMLTTEAITKEILNRTSHFEHQPIIKIRDSAEGVLPDATRNDRISGAVYDGVIWLFRDGMRDINEVRKTLFHELLHYGVRRFMSKDQYISTMARLYHTDEAVAKYADNWMATPEGQRTRNTYGVPLAKAVGVDEFLATLAEKNEHIFDDPSLVERVMRAVQKWLGQLAAALGMTKYAAQLYKMEVPKARELVRDLFRKIEQNAPAAQPWRENADPTFRIQERRANERTIEVDGERRPISNSTGRAIADSFGKQLAFYRWFGNSKAVDAAGRPLVVYHGTRFDFNRFDGYELAGWFSSDPQLSAERYAVGAGANVVPAYLRLENPKVIEGDMDDAGEGGAPMFEQINNADYVKQLQAEGYDGIVVNENGVRTYAAFAPEQIKSAVGNNGGFDPNDPNIMLSRMSDSDTGVNLGRRRLMIAAAAAAVAPGSAQAEAKLGRAVPIDAATLAKKVSPAVEKILRGNGATNIQGAQALTAALNEIAKSGPPALRALAAQTAALMPKDQLMLTVDDHRRVNAHGAVEVSPFPMLTLFTAEGRHGLSYGTVIHEAMHAAVLARYAHLSTGMIRSNDAILKMAAPAAAKAMAEFQGVWSEFRDATRGFKTADKDLMLSIEEARGNPDEFFVRSLTDARLQQLMAGRRYEGKTLLERFKDWVKTTLFGFGSETGVAPSWLDAALTASEGLASAMKGDKADFKRLAALQRELNSEGNSERSARADDTLYSRMNLGEALAGAANSVADVQLGAGYRVGDLFDQSGKIGWWHKTVGTMDNLAKRAPAFAKVYEAVQRFLGDVSRYATVAADIAPNLLPKLENIKDVLGKNRKKPLTAADTKAIAAPIFEGTLIWARDAHGKPVKVKQLEDEAEQMTIEQKAQVLLQKGIIDDEQNMAWLNSPLDFYDATINRRFAESQLKAGIVWSDEEMRSMFNLTDGQIALYREFRAAVDKSLTNLSISEMIKLGGDDAKGMMDRAVDAPDIASAAELLRDHFIALAQMHPDMADVHLDTAKQIMDLSDRAEDLMDRGYAPLSRFGKYTVYVTEKDDDGAQQQVYFGMFETAHEAARMARQMKVQHAEAEVLQGTVSAEAYKLFAGISPETIELFGSMVGLDSKADPKTTEVYQTYLKLAKNNRSAMKRLIHRKGIAGFNEDAGRVLAAFIYSNARLTAGNAHLGEIDEAVTEIPKQQGELTDAAMELRDFIKNPDGAGNKLGGLMFAQFLGGSVASAMVNLTQPFAMTLPYLSQWGGIRKAGKQLGAAIRDAGKKETGDARLDAALKWATEEGIVAPQEVHYLMAQAAGKGALQTGDGTKLGNARATLNNTMSKVSVGWGKLFAMAEVANRRITFIAAYRTAVEQGMANPDRFAQESVSQTQGTYNGGNKPKWARGAIGGLLMTFKQYSIAYIELLTRMATAGKPGSPERAAGQRAALYMVAILFLLGGADGLPFEQDLEDALDGILQRLGYNFSSKRAKQAFLTDVLGAGGADFALKGLSSMPGMPVDVSGRFGMGNLIPATGLLTKKESYTRDIAELAGPVADVATRTFTASGKLLGGDVAGAALDLAPVSVRNVAKGVDMASTGSYNDARGYKVNDVTALEAGMKALGFQPNSTADIQDQKGQALNMMNQTRMRSKEIAEHWAQGIATNDPEKVQEARAWRDDWNEKNPDTRITVNMPALQKRVRAMREDAIMRTTMTAPKALKQSVRRELSETRD